VTWRCALAAQKAALPWAAHPACGQQGEGGDSAPLLCSGETPPGFLHPILEPSAQDRPGPVGAGSEEVTK